MNSSRYVVYPGAWWGWDVVREGASEEMNFETRESALDFAFSIARLLGPADVVLEDGRGIVQGRWEYRGDAVQAD
jgi:hypothetical protein